MMDVYIMAVAGIFAFILKGFGFMMGPLLIAFILEPIFERAAREALAISGNNVSEVIFASPISIVLWIMLLGGIAYSIVSDRIKKKKGKA